MLQCDMHLMEHPMRNPLAAFALPWNAFVAVFVYYVLATLVVLGVGSLPALLVAVTYLLPPSGYAVLMVARGVRALAALPVEIGHTPHALLR